MKNKIIIFDYWSDFGEFKKYYTTSSPLSYFNIPKTSLLGIIGAIHGLKKDEYIEFLNKLEPIYSIKIKEKIRKIHVPENYVETKDVGNYKMVKFWSGTQVNMEVIRSPKYRIYISFTKDPNNEFTNNFEHMLSEHKTYYQPCMGISEFIANFRFINSTDNWEEINDNKNRIDISGFCPTEDIGTANNMEFEENKIYSKEKMPMEIDAERKVNKYTEIFFEISGQTLKISPEKYFSIKYSDNGKNIEENIILV